MGPLSVLGEECNLKDCEVSYGVKVGSGGTFFILHWSSALGLMLTLFWLRGCARLI